MTADPTPWFARTAGMSRADVAFAAEMMVFTLAEAVDQPTFDAALHTALTLLYGDVAEWEADLDDEPVPMVPTQRGGS